ncbi:MAG: hypothetical protein A3B47_02505 [Candidatus Levybacteria bacterium RIFCSPLOWO2_01_FULL_39_24]|nr:MAG: hypothetical protein A2800_01800 [Candidatus Levybacteria bacterium RIFCSPHIGHO2_01_FULL_40_16]OGH28267.1 MAG: hypothetical protein A3E12_02050 [Candidatus Levybacteria bacterium RIFCSPHIGHO2_12_FULL_39_9]OGH46501.1 MAG: hypothetical protein A3B47_02505 [Candidatus Levybacteria bacterium RIFCSPLOWO2_01_FULL_39_24]
MIKVSVIIISYNNLHCLKKNLDSLTNQTYDHNDIKVESMIVDSGSKTDSLRALQKYKDRIKIILKPQFLSRLSPAEARNMGVRNSTGDILIFSDADCILPPAWIQDIAECFKNPEIDCVMGSREPDKGQGLGTIIRRFSFILYSNKFSIQESTIINQKNLDKGEPLILLSGNNFAIKKKIWLKLGGMKTIFKNPAGEDVMLENDLIKNSYTILFNPFIKIIHFHPISLVNLFKKCIYGGEASYVISRYPDSLISYKYFIERGHLLSFGTFIFIILFIIFATSMIVLDKISFLFILFILFLLTSTVTFRLIKLKKKLSAILITKGKQYETKYSLSTFQLSYFGLIHFIAKTITLISFLRCYLFDGLSTLDLLLKNKSNDYTREARRFHKKTGLDLLRGHDKNVRITTSCSIIIPFCNNYFFLKKSLRALCNQIFPVNFKLSKIEIIIINDGSPICLEKLVTQAAKVYSTTYLKLKKNYGAATARNLGLLYAKNEVVFFLDEDMVVPNDFIVSHLLRHIFLKDCIIVGFRQNISLRNLNLRTNRLDKIIAVTPNYKNDFRYKRFVPQEWSGIYRNVPVDNFNKEYYPLINSRFFRDYGKGKLIGVWDLPSMFLSCNVSVRRRHITELGGFDMRFKNCGMEDVHLGAKLIAKGLYLIPNLHATAYHLVDVDSNSKQRTSIADYERKLDLYYNLRNEALIIFKRNQWLKQMRNYFANKFDVIYS